LFGGEDWLIVVIIALVLFGGAQLPKLARSLGEAQKELKKAMTSDDEDEAKAVPAAPAAVEPAAPAPQPVAPQPAATQPATPAPTDPPSGSAPQA
jgi:sec-independent protein translocase protein TatA